MADRAASPRIAHARHDPLAVAASLGPAGITSTGLGLRCPSCQALQADLQTILGALSAAWAPRRPRDFVLDATDAAGLRAHRWRGWLGAFGSRRDTVTRPLAGALASLGLAGLLLTAAPMGMVATFDVGAAASAQAPGTVEMHGAAPPAPQVVAGTDPAADRRIDPGSGRDDPLSPLVILSSSFLAAGGGVLALRGVAEAIRRRRSVR